ncbi:choice-of-anchor Q domain-containing protein [Marinicella sp. W31]|uniref:choice-of-anchor Q domain-containing protein n=1 Tax=Marinicella sp. W31 TaxID=3023713 RepID=UPI003756CCD8
MKIKFFCKVMAQLLIIGFWGIQAGHAGVITVNSIEDQPQLGLTTLREAIEIANKPSGDATIRGVGVIIEFDSVLFSTPQTITLQNGEINISASMNIIGPGAHLLTIDGDKQSRIFNINNNSSSDALVDITGITFINGSTTGPGGCINSHEILMLRNSVVENCSAGANGGGVHAFSVAATETGILIENSSFFNNTSGNNGGGLFHQNARDNLVINSTFSGNVASRNGGGIAVQQVINFDLINSTVSGNQAPSGAGVFSSEPNVEITSSTIVNNIGTGVFLDRDNIQNSIIALNTDTDCVFEETGFNNQNNFSSDGSCEVIDLLRGVINDPMLGPLADNGGLTLTHLPLSGSPVIDSGDDTICPEFDQRGETRPQDGDSDGTASCDIGAVELRDIIFVDGFDFSILDR